MVHVMLVLVRWIWI